MSLTITVADPLAGRLRTRAEVENIPVDRLASRLLESGMQPPLDLAQWTVVNRRRVALIEKQFHSGLSENEQAELQQLQELADRQVEEFDLARLNDVARMEASARSILGGAE